jgi:hypothetical protein
MRSEYDFSEAERGKFYRSDAELNLPVYLDADILDYLSSTAQSKGVEINELVNELLRKDIDLVERMKTITRSDSDT